MFEEDEDEKILTELPEGVTLVSLQEQQKEEFKQPQELPESEILTELPEGLTMPEPRVGTETRILNTLPDDVIPPTPMQPGVDRGQIFSGEYGPSDLLEGQRFEVVKDFLGSYYGTDTIDGYSKEEMVDQFLNTWRYLEAGNTVKTVGFVDHVLSTDERGKKAVAEGAELFKNLGGITSEAYTLRESLDAIRDYAWGAIVDPVNVIAPMFGKVFSQVGTKTSSKFALEMARREFTRQTTKGATPAVAALAANKIKGEALRRARAKVGRSEALREVMGAAAFDSAVAVGTDLAYQNGLIQAGAQEEQDRFQTGLAALGGIVGGAVGAAGVAIRGVSDLPMAGTDVIDRNIRDSAQLTGVFKALTDSVNAVPKVKFEEGFTSKVGRGKELEVTDTEFWTRLIAGDDEVGFDGLAQVLYDKGFRWMGKRSEDDNFSNWMGDAIKFAPEEEVLGFIKAFQNQSGITLKGMESPNIAKVADNLAKKMRDSGRALGAIGNASQVLKGKQFDRITVEDYGKAIFEGLDESTESATKKALENFSSQFGEGARFFQDSYIRMLVTHPGTSALNVIGWSAKSAGQSAADLVRGTITFGGAGLVNVVKGKGKNAVADWGKMAQIYRANFRKMANLVDPYTTKESFDSLVARNPKAFKDLTGILPGGVTRNVAEEFGINTKEPAYQQFVNKGIDFAQTLSFVKAQDAFTKSQEMMYNIDVALIEKIGMPYRELVRRPDASVLMNTKAYKEAEAQAMDRTLENILSKSYARQENMGLRELAGIIEDVRKIPVLGVHVPFGRFFNNVIATTSEYSGLTLAFKGIGGNVGQNKSNTELFAKALVGYAAVASLVPNEIELLQRGVAWDEDIDPDTGERFLERYDAPAVALKWSARRVAYEMLGMDVPEEFIQDGGKAIFGQLTRQLTESGDVFLDFANSLLAGEGVDALTNLTKMLQASGSTVLSGSTRFLEPINVSVALSKSSEEYSPPDTKARDSFTLSSFRYIDSLIDSVGLTPDAMEKVSPTAEYVSRQPGRLFGERPAGPQTALTRVFTMVGKPSWDAGLYATDREATNIVTREFRPIAEVGAQKLLDDPRFIEGSLAERQALLKRELERARQITHLSLANSPDYVDNRASLIFKLTQNRKVEDVEKYLAELGFKDTKLQDLRTDQLETLKFFIDSEKERLFEGLRR